MNSKRPIKVIHVKSWRDLPGAKEEAIENRKDKGTGIETKAYTSGVYGESDIKKRTIHIVDGAPKGALEHEKYHIEHGHRTPSKESEYVRQEMEAILYSYHKTGYPRTIKGYLKGIAETILWRRYKGYTKAGAIRIIQARINSMDVPERWIRDWDVVKREIMRA
jgi:hypothetical protein